MVVVLREQSETECASARADDEQLWIDAGEFQAATGWSLKPEGFCRGDTCVPVPPARAEEFVAGGSVNATAFWNRLGNPVVHDAAREVWVFGTSASDRSTSLQSPPGRQSSSPYHIDRLPNQDAVATTLGRTPTTSCRPIKLVASFSGPLAT